MIFSDRYKLVNDIWMPGPEYKFEYSDGDETENYILTTLQQSTDISIGSVELYSKIKDWPSLYHLSPKRADLLRPLAEYFKQGKILEIGSGCGAITRFIGEQGADVLALEGSPRRARITRERCRDLSNVQVLADNFQSFEHTEQFDCITLIGVLEYSNRFIQADNPPLALLEKVKQLLKPDGKLIIAIENKLGLKYFAGAPEDHLDRAYAGIEDRYNDQTVVTFGKKELSKLLQRAGLGEGYFFYPFPDYKLPSAIITEKGLQTPGFDVASLLFEKHEYIQQQYYTTNFSNSLAAISLHENGLMGDMSHSFLVIAGNENFEPKKTDLLAANFTSSRKKPYCKNVLFKTNADGSITVSKQKTFDEQPASTSAKLILEDEEYKKGKLLQEHLIRTVTRTGWHLDQLKDWASDYYNVLSVRSTVQDGQLWIDGQYLDLTPFNIILQDDGQFVIFDQEWDAGEKLPLFYVFFRGLYYSLGQVNFYASPAGNTPRTLLDLALSLFQQTTGVQARVEDYRNLEKKYFSDVWLAAYETFTAEPIKIHGQELMEEKIDELSSQVQELTEEKIDKLAIQIHELKPLEDEIAALQDRLKVKKQALAEKDRALIEKKQALTEKDLALTEVEQALTEKDRALTEKDRALMEIEQALAMKDLALTEKDRALTEKDQALKDLQFNYNLNRQQLEEANRTLDTIYNSDGWRWLSRYYRIKGKFLRENSFHYKVLRKVVNLVRGKKNQPAVIPGTNQQSTTIDEILEAVEHDTPVRPLPVFNNPEVSIIIPVYNAWAMNVNCVKSILENTTDISYEVIIADDCSTDKTKEISQYFPNIVHIRNEVNLGFIANCNHAAIHARGKYVHFLNNDTEVRPGWLSSLVSLFDKDDKIGMAGSKLVYPDGRLQEAGGIIWDDASGWNFGNGRNPDDPEFNYVKEVDYISGASIMVRTDIWKEMGGFDTLYSPAYCEDSDLSFRLREKGYKVVYQPLSVVIHYEGYSHGTDTAKSEISSVKEYQRINNQKFFNRWKAVLQRDQLPNGQDVFWARERSKGRKTLLMVDHYVPQFDKDAGSRTTFQYLELFVKLGYNVKFLGENFYRHEPYTTVLQQMGIEVLYGQWYASNWKRWFLENKEKFDYIYLNRPHISIHFIDFFREHSKARIIYYGHDLHFLRNQKQYEIHKDRSILAEAEKWKEIEMDLFRKSDVILTPSIDEQKIIKGLDSSFNVQLMRPYIYKDVKEYVPDFEGKRDIFFVGGFNHTPNTDAVLWFSSEVWPQIRKNIPGIRFIVAGSNPPPEVKDLGKDPDIIIKGYVADHELEELYATCRLAVIPLRYGAGVKGKTVEAMKYGIPLVTTGFGVEGLPGDFSFLKVADSSEEFANQVIELYHDEPQLREISLKSIRYIRENFTEDVAAEIIREALATV